LQLEQMRGGRPALPPGAVPGVIPGMPGTNPPQEGGRGTGQYL